MKTKDYIYLDEGLLNSHLAQFEKGLLVLERSEHGVESSDTINGSSKTTAGMDGIFGIGAKLQSELTEGDSNSESQFTQNMVENVLNDYAVDLLIENCKINDLILGVKSASEGDIVLFNSDFQIYDFEYLKNITNLDSVSSILFTDQESEKPGPQANKIERTEYLKKEAIRKQNNRSGKEGFELFNNIFTFASTLFDDSILIKTQNSFSICKRNGLRLNRAQASFENESARKIWTFGVVSAIKKETHTNGDKIDLGPSDLDKVSSFLFDAFLSNFHILNKGDKIIKPIAIYFEAD